MNILAFANVLARVGCVGVTEKYLMEPLLLKSWSFQYGAMTRCVIGNVLETYAVYGLPKLTSPLVLTCMNKRDFEITFTPLLLIYANYICSWVWKFSKSKRRRQRSSPVSIIRSSETWSIVRNQNKLERAYFVFFYTCNRVTSQHLANQRMYIMTHTFTVRLRSCPFTINIAHSLMMSHKMIKEIVTPICCNTWVSSSIGVGHC